MIAELAVEVLWFGMDLLTSISDAITVDRDERAGIRLGGFLLGIGLLSGWSVAGDWVSPSVTLKDFGASAWPTILLAAEPVGELLHDPLLSSKIS